MSALSYLSPKAEVRPSAIHGRGLFTEDLFIGPVRADDREGGMIFSNHSCEPNIGVLQRKHGEYMSWYLLRKIRSAGT
jgi:hypothetical protein